MILKIKKLHPNAIIPKYHSDGASGMDLHALEDTMIYSSATAGEENWKGVRTGIAVELDFKDPLKNFPLNNRCAIREFELQVRPRSGLALKYGVTILNTPGTIDSDYRGEIVVPLINHSRIDIKIEKGDRIAQLIVCPIRKVSVKEVTELSNTERGEGGFGSTGK